MAQVTATERDQRHLQRTIELAATARGHTSPNPLVGAVVAKGERTIGEGFHAAAGEPHAERQALSACSEDPAGATLYVSLEPCCHEGRTPPCTDAIVEAGIARVVVASDDPSEKASGRGLGVLRDEGVRVEAGIARVVVASDDPSEKASGRGLGVLRDEGVRVDVLDGDLSHQARLLNQPFRKHARSGRPLVVFKSAMTLDGKVATRTGDSQWISSEASRARVHRWRAESDAVAVGLGTALADDPQLTARVEAVRRQPRRVVFDSEARLPIDSRLVRGVAEAPLIVVVSRAAARTAVQGLESAGCDVVVASGNNEAARVESALDELGARGVQSLLLEGGPRLAGSFLEAGEIDEARIFIAPFLAGGRDARTAVEGMGVEQMAAAERALATEVERIEDDVLISARLREW